MSLQALYEQPQHVHFLQSRYYVEGVITGACACPEIPLPDTWLPWTIREHNQVEDSEQADYIFTKLFAFFKSVLAQMKDQSLALPSYAVYESESETSALSKYCQGLLYAHQATEKEWALAWQSMQQQAPEAAPSLSKDLQHCLLVFSTFANPKLAIEQASARDESELSAKLPLIAASLPQTLAKYVSISGEVASFLPDQFETFQQPSN